MEEELEEENTDKQGLSPRERQLNALKPYQWKKGQSGNSLGRYVGGLSGKERMKRKIAGMTDDEFEDFIEGLDKRVVWEMGEGKPQQDTKIDGNIDVKVSKLEEIQTSLKNVAGNKNNSEQSV
jgi:hypothetical protein